MITPRQRDALLDLAFDGIAPQGADLDVLVTLGLVAIADAGVVLTDAGQAVAAALQDDALPGMIPIDHYMRNQRTDTTVAYVFRNKKESRCCFATCRAPALAAAGAKALYQFSLTRTCVPSRADRWT